MKKYTLLFAIVLLLSVVTGTVQADGAEVVFFPGPGADNCFLGWFANSESGPIVVFVQGSDGLNVDTPSTPSITTLTCHGSIDFGETVEAIDPIAGIVDEYELLTHQEVCLALPAACNGQNGSLIFNFENTGFPCTSRNRPTTEWQEVVSPSGQASIICHFSN